MGRDVVAIDRDAVGAGASLAATGMLAAAAEYEPGGEILLPFALASRRLWAEFAAELAEASGVDLDYDKRGTLLVALTRDEVDRLRARLDLHARIGLDTQWVSSADLRRLEPGLRPSVAAGLSCPQDAQVDPRRLMPALRRAFENAGGVLVEGCAVEKVEREAGSVAGVVCAGVLCRSDTVIIATGAWAGSDQLLPSTAAALVRPLRGQALALRGSPAAAPIRHVVWTEQVHLAPKADGRLIVGATVEETGFDASVTAGGIYALLEGARRALPSIEDMPLEAVWSGFRPTSVDDAPILGDSGQGGLLLAIGHHRNGVLLAPATAQAVAAIALGREPMREAEALGLARFRRTR
jgi:glycine oxidase